MTTAALQIVGAVLKLAFGLVALGVARSARARDVHRLGWLLVGVVLAAGGASNLLQSSWAMRAFLSGEGTAVWNSYLRWAPAMNFSRHLSMIALAGLLCALPALARLRGWRVGVIAGGAILLSAALGGWVGAAESSLVEARHYPATAMLDSLEMLLLFAALIGALAFGWMDRWLWTILAIYAVRQSFNVISFSALAWRTVTGAWAPGSAHIKWVATAMWVVLLAIALHRLRLARRGTPVSGLLETPGVEEGGAIRTFH